MLTTPRKGKTSRTSPDRRASERGAALVESAIVFLPLCIVLFGILDYGFIFKDSLSLSSATRAGARTASAEPRTGDFYSDTVDAVVKASSAVKFQNGDDLFIYKAAADGMPQGASGNKMHCVASCVRYTWNGTAFAVSGGAGWPVTSQVACVGKADTVGVALRVSHDTISGFFQDIQLYERTTMRFEPLDTDCEGA